MRCGYHTHTDGVRYFIPGCMQGWDNERWCICYKPIYKVKGKKAQETIEHMENECRMLRAQNEKLNKQNAQLRRDNAELLRAGLPVRLRLIIARGGTDLYLFMRRLIDK